MGTNAKINEINDLIMQDVNLAQNDQRVALEILELVLKAVEKTPKTELKVKTDCESVFKMRLSGFGNNVPHGADLALLQSRSFALASDNGLIAMLAQDLQDTRKSNSQVSSSQSISFALPLYMCKLTEDQAKAITDKAYAALQDHIKHSLVFEAHAQSSLELLLSNTNADASMLKQVQNSLIIQRNLNERLKDASNASLAAYEKLSVYLALAEALFTLCCAVPMLVNSTRIFALAQAQLTMAINQNS